MFAARQGGKPWMVDTVSLKISSWMVSVDFFASFEMHFHLQIKLDCKNTFTKPVRRYDMDPKDFAYGIEKVLFCVQ